MKGMGRRTEKLVCTFVLGAGMGGGTGRGEAGKEEDTTKRDKIIICGAHNQRGIWLT